MPEPADQPTSAPAGAAATGARVETVLVIKGAGNHRPGQTLDLFLSGFWPAVFSVDPAATMRLVGAVDPGGSVPRTASATSEAGHASAVEIDVPGRAADGERRAVAPTTIRVREVYWEPGLAAPSATHSVLREWDMASYALGQSLLRAWKPRMVMAHAPKPLHFLYGLSTAILVFIAVSIEPASVPFLDPTNPVVDAWERFGAWRPAIMAALAGALVFVARWLERLPPSADGPRLASYAQDAGGPGVSIASLESHNGYTYRGGRHAPGLPLWVLIALVTVLVVSPLRYVAVILGLVFLQLCILLARWLLWPFRAIEDSDTAQIFDERLPGNEAEGGQASGRSSAPADPSFRRLGAGRLAIAALRLPLSAVLYRLVVVLTLPIVLSGSAVVTVLRWTRVLAGVGDMLDGLLRLTLAGTMGDIVSYSMEPGQAIRVREVLERELTEQDADPAVRRVHVVAHSQGTPITYEVLFGSSPGVPRAKVRSYLTIGSVLSLYAQSNDVLDLLPHPRFPVSTPPRLPGDFHWVNVWNLTDPITEFTGLDEYSDHHGRSLITQVRTPAKVIPWRSHSSYWDNLTLVMRPLARRVLGAPADEQPRMTLTAREAPWRRAIAHALGVVLVGAALAVTGPPAMGWLGREVAQFVWLAVPPREFDKCAFARRVQGSLETLPVAGSRIQAQLSLAEWLQLCPLDTAPAAPVARPPHWFADLKTLLYLVTWVLGLGAVASDLGRAVLRSARRGRAGRWLTPA